MPGDPSWEQPEGESNRLSSLPSLRPVGMTLEIRWPEGIPQSEINMTFFQEMADRMAMSYYKYGGMRGKPGEVFDHLASVVKRIEIYQKTGNTEGLVDAANFLMIEFTNPSHPDAYFEGTDSDASPGIKYVDGPWVQKPDF